MDATAERNNRTEGAVVLGNVEERKRDLALVYLMTSIDTSRVHRMQKARRSGGLDDTLKQNVSVGIRSCSLRKAIAVAGDRVGERQLEYQVLHPPQGLISKLEYARHGVPAIHQKRALLRGLPADFDVTLETNIDSEYDYQKRLSKLIVREAKLAEKNTGYVQALVARKMRNSRKLDTSGKQRYIALGYWFKSKGIKGKSINQEKRVWLKCGKQRNITKNCQRRQKGESGSD